MLSVPGLPLTLSTTLSSRLLSDGTSFAIPHPYHARTRNDREQPELTGGRIACYGWVSAGFAWSADSPKMGDVELITRRSRVQIPPPLLNALVSDLLTGVSTVPGTIFSGSLQILALSLPGLLPHL